MQETKSMRVWISERFGVCAKCGKEQAKKRMTAIYIKSSTSNPKILCHICGNCLPALLDYLAVGAPE